MAKIISLIVAMGRNRLIGINNQLPWRLSADLQRFKQLTMGKTVIMGRKTFQSIGKALPGRKNIVISSDVTFQAHSCQVVKSLEAAIAASDNDSEVMIIGGASVYAQALPLTDKIYLTVVEAELIGDSYFPELDEKQWHEISREYHQADEKNQYAYNFIDLERIKS